MNIEVGSKWIRKCFYYKADKVYSHYFLGQEVVILKDEYPFRGWVHFMLFDAKGNPLHPTQVEEFVFIKHFEPLNVTLENK